MRSTFRCAECWTCCTLLASPDPASSGRDRACLVPLRGVLVSFFCQNIKWYIRTYRHRQLCLYIMKGKRCLEGSYSPVEYEVAGSIPGVRTFSFSRCALFCHLFWLPCRHRVSFHTGCLNLIYFIYTAVDCCTTFEYVFAYTCHVFLLLLLCVLLSCFCCSCSAAASCCCSSSCAE